MRSDRNPYFFLKKSKDPHVQHMLSEAPHMSMAQIDALKVKPDLRKAMHFVRVFGAPERSQTVADLSAHIMQQNHKPPPDPLGTVYEYVGPPHELKIHTQGSRISHTWHMEHDVFLLLQDRIWFNHTWCAAPEPKHEFWSYCTNKGEHHLNQFNQIIHTHVNQKHHK